MGAINRHKHVNPRRRRWGAPGAVALLSLSVVFSASVPGSASVGEGERGRLGLVSADDPQRVLQSVSVDVGSDGSITAIDSNAISKTQSSDLTSTEESFDPTALAGDLPVRILTSYRLGERSGTDLSEIVGESGRVVVDVIVQNTTVRPQRLSYDVGSTRREQYALVGAPLTVVATAGLGEAGLTRVVTDDGAGADPDTVTNGVLGRAEDDEVQVQWASLLAPPRLSPSVTFRLVQETEDFEVPTFDINVQPGLVTDTSVENLLASAFSDDAGSTLQLEGRTIALVGQVTGALEIASDGLSDIERLLDTSAETIGQRTIADLTSSSGRITSELRGLSSELDSLNTDIDSQLESTQSSTLSQLASTVSAIQDRLGDPGHTPPPAPVEVKGCAFDFSDKIFGSSSTVYAQLLRVQAQMTAIGSASRACADDLAEDLRTAIGSTEVGYACEPGSAALICRLEETKDSINEQAVGLSAVGTGLAGRFEADRLQDLRTGVAEVNSTVARLQGTAQSLADGDSALNPLLEKLLALQSGLTDLQAVLQPGSSNGIPATLDAIHDQALLAVSALGRGDGYSSVSDQARAAAAASCALPPAVPVPPVGGDVPAGDARDEVSVLLTGATCGGADAVVPASYAGLSVAERAEVALSAVSEVADLSDLAHSSNPVNQQLQGLRISVGDLLSLVVGVITSDAPGLKNRVKELAAELAALGVGTDSLPTGTDCPADATTTEDDLTALNRSFRRLYCKQAGLEDYITEQFGTAGTVLGRVQDDLAGGQSTANAARLEARNAVNETTAQLSKRLDKAGNALRTKGAREIAAQRRRLDTEVATVTRLLSKDIAVAVGVIDNRVRIANGNLEESQQRLVGDLARVLTDIGDAGGSGAGLLGALAGGASETRLSNESIIRVSDTASAFRNLRSAAMEDTLLQQAQLARSLEMQQELPAFGLDLPSGSRYVSVFSFHVGQG